MVFSPALSLLDVILSSDICDISLGGGGEGYERDPRRLAAFFIAYEQNSNNIGVHNEAVNIMPLLNNVSVKNTCLIVKTFCDVQIDWWLDNALTMRIT